MHGDSLVNIDKSCDLHSGPTPRGKLPAATAVREEMAPSSTRERGCCIVSSGVVMGGRFDVSTKDRGGSSTAPLAKANLNTVTDWIQLGPCERAGAGTGLGQGSCWASVQSSRGSRRKRPLYQRLHSTGCSPLLGQAHNFGAPLNTGSTLKSAPVSNEGSRLALKMPLTNDSHLELKKKKVMDVLLSSRSRFQRRDPRHSKRGFNVKRSCRTRILSNIAFVHGIHFKHYLLRPQPQTFHDTSNRQTKCLQKTQTQ